MVWKDPRSPKHTAIITSLRPYVSPLSLLLGREPCGDRILRSCLQKVPATLLGADFWEVGLDSNFSVFGIQRLTEWPGPLHWIAFPVEILTKPLIHSMPPPFSLKNLFFFTEKCFVATTSQKSVPSYFPTTAKSTLPLICSNLLENSRSSESSRRLELPISYEERLMQWCVPPVHAKVGSQSKTRCGMPQLALPAKRELSPIGTGLPLGEKLNW